MGLTSGIVPVAGAVVGVVAAGFVVGVVAAGFVVAVVAEAGAVVADVALVEAGIMTAVNWMADDADPSALAVLALVAFVVGVVAFVVGVVAFVPGVVVVEAGVAATGAE